LERKQASSRLQEKFGFFRQGIGFMGEVYTGNFLMAVISKVYKGLIRETVVILVMIKKIIEMKKAEVRYS
jgi:hypothetical protein